MAESIQAVSIVEETRHRYLHYALSVIQSRALPDVRDGLKPVQRRILYTMLRDLHLTPDAKPRKCAKIIGDVVGNYHPHSPEAVYDALVRQAQPWVMRVPLVFGQGNFGSVEGDAPAHYRYTEAKLAAAAMSLLAELRQNTVETRPNYDNTREEPVVLPAQFPNLLVNGSAGIAVGMAANIPPHNLGEICRACVALIDDPEVTTAELLNKVKGPDFPLGGKIIADRATLRRIYEDGNGSIKIQAEWKVEQTAKGKHQIVIHAIPYGTQQNAIETEIGNVAADRKLPQLLGVTNESNEKQGMRLVVDIKPGSDPAVIMAYLYKHTKLQESFAFNMTCLSPGDDGILQPRRLGLKAILRHFLDFRLATVRKRFEYELDLLLRRIHVLEGFRVIFNDLDKAIGIIRQSGGKADAAAKLIAEFGIDDEQAGAVLDAQLYKIASMEIRRILDELEEKNREARKLEAVLGSEAKLWGVIKDELTKLADEHGDRRRSRMAGEDDVLEFDEEAYIARENTNVVLTRDGWLKRVGRLQSVETTRVREGDEVLAVVPGSTLDHVIFFADDGTAYTMRMNDVPASSGYGEPITKFFKMADQVKVVAAVTTDTRFTPADDDHGPMLLVATAQGNVVRTPLAAFRAESTKAGRRYVKLGDGDKVVLAAVVRDETSVFLAATSGHVIHFPLEEVSVLAGVGRGVAGIKLEAGAACLGGALIGNRFDALAVETTGGKALELRRGAHPTTHRGGKGTEVVKRAGLARVVPPPIQLVDWDAVEGKEPKAKAERNGDAPRGLFE